MWLVPIWSYEQTGSDEIEVTHLLQLPTTTDSEWVSEWSEYIESIVDKDFRLRLSQIDKQRELREQ